MIIIVLDVSYSYTLYEQEKLKPETVRLTFFLTSMLLKLIVKRHERPSATQVRRK